MKKISRQDAINELWQRGHLSFKLDKNQKELYDLFYNSDFKIQTWLLSRRCLAKGTLVKTPNGLIKIEELKIGDDVYGYNEDGSVSITKVVKTFYNGKKEVVDLCSSFRELETCTLDHVWLTQNTYDKKLNERRVLDIKNHTPIVRKWVDYKELSGIFEPHAYALGALLGDGCSREGNNKLHISSENEIIPKKIAEVLNCKYYKLSGNNYTWAISITEKYSDKFGNKNKVLCNYYEQWCKGRYAHEKKADLNVIKSWDYKSQLAFLAGLLDTDGSVTKTKDNCLVIQIGMQAKSIIEAAQYIIHNLFQFKTKLRIDSRKKYKNGPVYSFSIKNNLISKMILKALIPYSVCERKKWKDEYELLLENNTNRERVGVKVKNPRIEDTYDIQVGNKTNLYLTANGLVTHNSGKTRTLLVLALEQLIRQPNSIVKFLSPTKLQCNNNVRPLLRELLEDCPKHLLPEFRAKDYIFFFPNGSELQLAGSDGGHAEKLRGGSSWVAMVDEAGEVKDLDNIVKSILLPTTLTTKGKILLAGTPPKTPDHDFVRFIEEAELRGSLIKKTVYDNPRLTREDIDSLINELGGPNASAAKRELFCELVQDENSVVIPEFTPSLEKEVVKEWPTPPFFDAYVSMDLGFKDLTAVLFGYLDFRLNKIVIEDELCFNFNEADNHIKKLSEEILEKEAKLWTNPLTGEIKKPYMRVSDINYIVTNEIYQSSGKKLSFVNADKDDKETALSNLRVLLGSKKIVINPRCVNLIRHLKNAKWHSKANKKAFARSPDNGHYDFVDALIYFVRKVQFSKNPYPIGYDLNLRQNDAFFPSNTPSQNYSHNSQIEAFRKVFGLRKK